MKNLLTLTVLFISLSAAAASNPKNVNEKVINTFNQIFKEAKNVTWSSAGNYSEANFALDNITTKAMIDNNGNLVQTIRYYKEKSLPANILFAVKKAYSQQEIWGVTETTNVNGSFYHITLKDTQNWYNVLFDAKGNHSLQSKYKRAELQ